LVFIAPPDEHLLLENRGLKEFIAACGGGPELFAHFDNCNHVGLPCMSGRIIFRDILLVHHPTWGAPGKDGSDLLGCMSLQVFNGMYGVESDMRGQENIAH
jgi:hypothetical protein